MLLDCIGNQGLASRLAILLLIGFLILQRGAGSVGVEAADAAAKRGDCETAQEDLRSAEDRGVQAESEVRLASTLENLGQCWAARGGYVEAQHAFERALELRERIHGPHHASIGRDLHAIGWLSSRIGQLDRAGYFHERALESHTAVVGPEHPDAIQTLGDLAFVRYQQGRIDEAEQLNLRALRIRERTLGEKHLAVAESLNLAGLIARSRGRMGEAEREFGRALAIHDRLREPAISRWLPFGLGDPLSRFVSALEPEHPDVGSVLSNLAEVQAAQGRLAEALRSMERAVEVLEGGLGSAHPHLGAALGNLASLYRRLGKMDLAERAHARSLDVLGRSLPSDPPKVAAAGAGPAPTCLDTAIACRASN